MRTAPFLALALCIGFSLAQADRAAGQEPPKGGPPPKTLVIYGQFRELMNDGKFDIAANSLQAFLEANPTPADFLEIERKYGTTAFTGLRTVPKWSDDRAFDKKARENVEEAITRSRAATAKLLEDPARVEKYIRNLGATYEERVFAELELKRTGDFAIPLMVDALRTTRDKDVYAGILGAIPKLEPQTTAAWIAALDGLTPAQQQGVISAIASRQDVLNLQTAAQTELTPVLWRVLAQPVDSNPTARLAAEKLLNAMRPGLKAELKVPQAELVAIARTFYEHAARYSGGKTNPDGTSATVPVWVWDTKNAENPKLVKNENVPVGQADEYFGLRYARWALETKPDYEAAQGLVLALAAERAVERAKYGHLATAEPGVFKLLSDAPSSVLNDLLNRGLNQKKTALVLAMVQVLGDRGDRDAATPPAGNPPRPSLLARALAYDDQRVRSPRPTRFCAHRCRCRRSFAAGSWKSSGSRRGWTRSRPEPRREPRSSPTRTSSAPTSSRCCFAGWVTTSRCSRRAATSRACRPPSDYDLILIDHHAANRTHRPRRPSAPTPIAATVRRSSSRRPRSRASDVRPTSRALRVAHRLDRERDRADAAPIPRRARHARADEGASQGYRRETRWRVPQHRGDSHGPPPPRRREHGRRIHPSQKLLFDLRLELITYAVLEAEFPISRESSPETFGRIATPQADRSPAARPDLRRRHPDDRRPQTDGAVRVRHRADRRRAEAVRATLLED